MGQKLLPMAINISREKLKNALRILKNVVLYRFSSSVSSRRLLHFLGVRLVQILVAVLASRSVFESVSWRCFMRIVVYDLPAATTIHWLVEEVYCYNVGARVFCCFGILAGVTVKQ